jgi:hypothetical protein
MDSTDPTDTILAGTTALVIFSCTITVLLTALFPCSCNPRRDCRRNCADCKRDREICRKRCCMRERSDTEDELIMP